MTAHFLLSPPVSFVALLSQLSNSVKFVPCLSVNVHVKTFIMMMTNNDDDYIQLGHVYIPRPHPPSPLIHCIQRKLV